MRWRAAPILGVMMGLAGVGHLLPARAGEPVPVAMALGQVRQLGPAYPGAPVALAVEVRNTGQNECDRCRVRVLGGGQMAGQPLPRVRPGEAGTVSVGGLVFSRPGKYILSIGIHGPGEAVRFTGDRPHAVYELTVLEGPPVPRREGR